MIGTIINTINPYIDPKPDFVHLWNAVASHSTSGFFMPCHRSVLCELLLCSRLLVTACFGDGLL
ncbi:MAG: hypothetical protein H7Z39_01210 [Burkholderiaceae bacterium]|nr:hypothetical protein [Burkholderiaceae bacterium]